jgi:hypothetical protein
MKKIEIPLSSFKNFIFAQSPPLLLRAMKTVYDPTKTSSHISTTWDDVLTNGVG